jgi:hypothetical protein
MNTLDSTIVRLGIYIGQLESQVQELHRQLVEKIKEFDEYRKAHEPTDKPLDRL